MSAIVRRTDTRSYFSEKKPFFSVVTFAKNKFTGHWYSFTDDDVTKIDETDIVVKDFFVDFFVTLYSVIELQLFQTNGAYILFYIRRKCHENEAVLDDEIKDLQVSSK